MVYWSPPTAVTIFRYDKHVGDGLLVEEHPEGFPFVRASLGGNPLPPGSLDPGPVVRMWGRPVQVVTLDCLFVMKASGNFTNPREKNAQKHRDDLELIVSRLPPETPSRLRRYFKIDPLDGIPERRGA